MIARVERALDDAATAGLSANARVTHTEGSYRAEVRVASASGWGERVLENERCDVLADSVALVIALSASRAEGRSRELRFGVSAHATTLSGPLPSLAFGAGGSVSAEGVSGLRLELGASSYAHQTATFAQSDLGGRFSLVRFGARACWIWSIGRVDLAPCAGAQLFWIEGTGFGGQLTQQGDALVWGPALGLFARLRLLRGLSITLAADGVAALSRRRFTFSDLGPLHQPAALAFQWLVAPEVLF